MRKANTEGFVPIGRYLKMHRDLSDATLRSLAALGVRRWSACSEKKRDPPSSEAASSVCLSEQPSGLPSACKTALPSACRWVPSLASATADSWQPSVLLSACCSDLPSGWPSAFICQSASSAQGLSMWPSFDFEIRASLLRAATKRLARFACRLQPKDS